MKTEDLARDLVKWFKNQGGYVRDRSYLDPSRETLDDVLLDDYWDFLELAEWILKRMIVADDPNENPPVDKETLRRWYLQTLPPASQKGFLEIGINEQGEVVVNHPNLVTDENGVGHIVFSPGEARLFAQTLTIKAREAEDMKKGES